MNGKNFHTDFAPKKVDCTLMVLQPVVQKIQSAENFFTLVKFIRNRLLSLFSYLSSERKMSIKAQTNLKYVNIPLENAVRFKGEVILLSAWKSLDSRWREVTILRLRFVLPAN